MSQPARILAPTRQIPADVPSLGRRRAPRVAGRLERRAALRLVLGLAALLATLVGGCGKEIGDSCFVNTDCDPSGERFCDNSSNGGYCTVIGCSYGTCPDDAVCVRFYAGTFDNKPCDPATEDTGPTPTDACSLDEVCAINGKCALRSTENRYCMKSCGDNGDCRDNYECRNVELMKAHGGEPVQPDDQTIDPDRRRFCAQEPLGK